MFSCFILNLARNCQEKLEKKYASEAKNIIRTNGKLYTFYKIMKYKTSNEMPREFY